MPHSAGSVALTRGEHNRQPAAPGPTSGHPSQQAGTRAKRLILKADGIMESHRPLPNCMRVSSARSVWHGVSPVIVRQGADCADHLREASWHPFRTAVLISYETSHYIASDRCWRPTGPSVPYPLICGELAVASDSTLRFPARMSRANAPDWARAACAAPSLRSAGCAHA